MTPRPWHPPKLLPHPTQIPIPPQQANVLDGICRGWSDEQIGRHLYITHNTVKTHIKRLLRRTGATNRAHLAALTCTGQLQPIVTNSHIPPHAHKEQP